jgi:hypothetical protein
MYWELKTLFFENEVLFSRTVSFWKPSYGKIEYKANIYSFIHSFSILSDDGFKTPSETIPQHSAI